MIDMRPANVMTAVLVAALAAAGPACGGRSGTGGAASTTTEPKAASSGKGLTLQFSDKPIAMPAVALTDVSGHPIDKASWTGKVVLVNFWATWCPPCRKEMPDLDALASEFRDRGLVILALSNEPEAIVRAFVAAHPVHYPILLDANGRVGEALKIDSIPKSFVYDRTGRMVAQSIDMRTRGQFLAMLKAAGL